MHTYIKSPQGGGNYLYTVGFDAGATEHADRSFFALRDFATETEAAAFTNYLNGGRGLLQAA